MNSPEHYGRPADVGEIARLGVVLAQAFGLPPGEAEPWFATAGVNNLRALRRDGETVAGLMLVPMGQFWGGRSVPMMGFAAVGTAPHARGTRAATGLMLAALREVREAGYALGALYPSAQTLYRRVGFEQAGARFLLNGPVAAFAAGDRSLPMRPFTEADAAGVAALYAKGACHRQGWLDRGPYVWKRVQHPRGMHSLGHVVGGPGEVAGFIFYSLAKLPKLGLHHDMHISGWAASSVAAWRRLWTFVADHASVVDEVNWHGSLEDPALLLLAEQSLTIRLREFWMLRVLDVQAAFSARGYPASLRGELHIDLHDRSLPEGSGRFVVQIRDGRAEVDRGGRAELELDERSLAALYAGQRRASELARLGLLQAPGHVLELADALLGGQAASMSDMF